MKTDLAAEESMNVIEAISSRRSIRAFRPDPIPRKIIQAILQNAILAPSWANTQPWEFVIVGGQELDELKQALTHHSKEIPNPDIIRPAEFPEPYDIRRSELVAKILEMKGIKREDGEKREWWNIQMARFFEAPNAILICMDKSIYSIDGNVNVWSLFSCGLVATNITLLGVDVGLGTCIEYVPVLYPDVIRQVLAIPSSKLIVVAIAIGYPNRDDQVNHFRSQREPLTNITRWCGVD